MWNYQSVTKAAAGTSDWILVDPTEKNWRCSVHAEHNATCTYDIEVTGAPTTTTTASVDAFKLTNATGLTANTMLSIEGPIAAIRINITSYTSGDGVTLHVRQVAKGVNSANPNT